MAKNTPPKTVKRNEHGLLEGIKYSYQSDGLIDWRKMVKNEHIVPNRDNTSETDVTKLKDKDLIIHTKLSADHEQLFRDAFWEDMEDEIRNTKDSLNFRARQRRAKKKATANQGSHPSP